MEQRASGYVFCRVARCLAFASKYAHTAVGRTAYNNWWNMLSWRHLPAKRSRQQWRMHNEPTTVRALVRLSGRNAAYVVPLSHLCLALIWWLIPSVPWRKTTWMGAGRAVRCYRRHINKHIRCLRYVGINILWTLFLVYLLNIFLKQTMNAYACLKNGAGGAGGATRRRAWNSAAKWQAKSKAGIKTGISRGRGVGRDGSIVAFFCGRRWRQTNIAS